MGAKRSKDFTGSPAEVVKLKNVWLTLGSNVVLQDVSFSVKENTLLGIVGPNGAGKTTLCKVILGLVKPDRGTVNLFGRPLRARGDKNRLVGYLPQRQHFDQRFPVSVLDVVMMGRIGVMGLFRFPARKDKKEALKSLERVGLPKNIAGRPIGELSGGQQQLVFLARALCGHTRLLLLDEPTNNLDIFAQEKFYHTVSQLKNEMGLTVIVVSHDLAAVFQHADEIICLNKSIYIRGRPETVVKNTLFKNIYGCERGYYRSGNAVL